MDQLLLIDPDIEHGRAVAAALRSFCPGPAICTGLRTAIALMETRAFAVIVIVTTPSAGWDGYVETIRHAALKTPCPPRIVCLLRGPYRGPSERIYAARKGFTVVYER